MSNLPAMAKNQIQAVENKVQQLQQSNQIELPADYSVSNALRSAFLTLQETKDSRGRPALEACTQPSITNALLDMIVQGLTPARKQAYFIAYGDQLICQPSYFGEMAIAKRVDPRIADIVSETVHEGDEFEFELVHGRKRVVKHKQTLDSLDGKITGAYATLIDHQGREIATEIMTWKELLKSWSKSPVKPVQNGSLKENSTHANHPGEMAKRTVIRKLCKPVIRSGSDTYIRSAYERPDQIQAQGRAEAVASSQANQGEIIDIDSGSAEPAAESAYDPETGEVEEEAPLDPEYAKTEPGF